MSRPVAAAAVRGSHDIHRRAEKHLQQAIEQHGPDQEIGFPETAFYLPMANALLGAEAKTLADAQEIMDYTKTLLHEEPTEELWLPYLPSALDSGIATLLAEEVDKALCYLEGSEPLEGWHGFISDTILRTLGIQLVDGRMPGFAAVVGAAPDVDTAVHVVRELQKRNILVFLVGNVDGKTARDQLLEGGVLNDAIIEDPKQGWDIYVVPVGPDTEAIIHVLNWAIRGALTFGGHKAGEWKACLDYTRAHIFAFGLGLGEIDDLKFASGAGAIDMGFPVIADTPIPEIRPTGVCTYEELVHELDHEQIVPTCIDVRGVKVTVRDIDVPVPVAAAFEGEVIRRDDMQVELGGRKAKAFEYVKMRAMDEVEDGKITVTGAELDTFEQGSAHDFGIFVEVAGRKMQEDFEPIFERRVHEYVNYAHGIFHMGQRDLAWLRVSKEAHEAGWRLEHFGTVLYAEMKNEFGNLADKVQIAVTTDPDVMAEILPEAREAYHARDLRIAGMKDEDVDTFYSCTLCQSYAPNHVCVVSPERLGLCGAYSWLDCRAAYEISPTGPNQPVEKGECLDPVMGQWKNVNEFTYQNSNRSIEQVNLYSVMVHPMTSCGCFECIMAIIPEANGFMIVNREYPGMTPCGMPFSTLAGSVGGGNQTPGFLGVGRRYVLSHKFIFGDGGLPRMVWMPKELREDLGDELRERCAEIEMPDLYDQIATEEEAEDSAALLEHLTKVGHPALTMDSLF